MRKRNTEHLSEIILQFLKENRLDEGIAERQIVESWALVLGGSIMNYSSNIYVKRRVLYVSISSAVLRHDLFLSKNEIINSLNKHVGMIVIDDIVFR